MEIENVTAIDVSAGSSLRVRASYPVQFVGRLIFSLTLCAMLGLISGCATVQTSAGYDEEEEEVVAEKRAPEKKVEKRKAEPRKRAARTGKRSAPRKSAPVAPVAEEAAAPETASAALPVEKNGSMKWLWVIAPIAVATAGYRYIRNKRRNGKAPVNLRNGGSPPGPSPPGGPGS